MLFKPILIHFNSLQLPVRISDSEVATLARMFSPNSLETVAIEYLELTETDVDNAKFDNQQNSDGFKRELLFNYMNRGNSRKVNKLSYLCTHYFDYSCPILINYSFISD